ncbi:phosphoribosylformylglycinamidine cyclo-ligase [bacterium]|nr:phosphoribosylformylglycinamidine cyclo-ligase [bacterium]
MDYKASGVDISAGNRAVELIKNDVQRTHSPHVLKSIGGFAAPFELPEGYRQPVLVSCTDGVGTKLKIALELGRLNTVGIDLVAMCVNDLICCGAKPLFFLDYIACHKLVPEQMASLISGMTAGCLEAGCSLVGGEMAEMNDLYRPGDFDLAGFSVGVVEKSSMIDGSRICPGHYVYGIPSSGLHSNGFSLVRSILTRDVCEENDIEYESLLKPTRIYVKEIMALLKLRPYHITGIAHITGGGIVENVTRIVPQGCHIEIEQESWNVPLVFEQIQTIGRISPGEMGRVFNMGIGMIVVASDRLPESDDLIRIGTVVPGIKGATVL